MRIEYPGAIYHIMSRGDRREDIFHDEVDRQDFLKTLAEACQKADFRVHAYCLMRNHFHLVHRRSIAASGVGASRPGTTEPERAGETGTCGTVAPGNDVDDQRDRPAAILGQLEERHHSAPEPETKGQTIGNQGIVIV